MAKTKMVHMFALPRPAGQYAPGDVVSEKYAAEHPQAVVEITEAEPPAEPEPTPPAQTAEESE